MDEYIQIILRFKTSSHACFALQNLHTFSGKPRKSRYDLNP